MAIIKPFRGIRPVADKVKHIASRPYDVLNSLEAREEAKGNPYSFLHVVKPEIDLPEDTDPHDNAVYEKGRENFMRMVHDGVFVQDEDECVYIYELTMNAHTQTGIVACAAVQDYMNDVIKKHELTRPDKEEDRKKHVRVSMMNAEPVFFAYPGNKTLDEIAAAAKERAPIYDFKADDGVRHRFWKINNPDDIAAIVNIFAGMPSTYVADGHHRTAAAALVGEELKKENPDHTGTESYNYFLAVHFPDNQLQIIDYNRVVRDLNGMSEISFIDQLKERFEVEEIGPQSRKPEKLHEFSMYLDKRWYTLTAKPGAYDDNDPIGVLDVTVLSEQVLKPLLNIQNLRTDQRIDFVGGIRGLPELERRVDSGEMKVAFALYPVSMQQLIDIADSGAIMPPKTTWFEPKLRSGLVIHKFG